MKKTLLTLALATAFYSNAQYQVLHDFNGTDGGNSVSSLIGDGTYLYGTTAGGGANGDGNVFRIKPDGTGFQSLHDFTGSDGKAPNGSLLSDGTYLYGTTAYGGTPFNVGTMFRIKTDGTGFTQLHTFYYGSSTGPNGALVSDGTYLYGLTNTCMLSSSSTIFRVKPDGTSYMEIFTFNGTNGDNPKGSLILNGTNLYGLTKTGGANGSGVIFKVDTGGQGYTDLYDFTGGTTDGANPYGSLITDGTYLYGMTNAGGINNHGTIFKIKFDGTGYTNYTNMVGGPFGDLYNDGTYLYGMTEKGGLGYGEIFKIKPDFTGYTSLFTFNGVSDGSYPRGALYSDGNYFYGLTESNGAYNYYGTIFKFCANGSCNARIAEHDNYNTFKIYPNPASSSIQVEGINFQDQGKKIYDVIGNTVLQSKQNAIDVSSLENGVYYIKIGNSTQKFIKQ
ncbi:MAG: T9SS type A sorting domain-containing protein [Bacteroidia bacterium]